MFKRTGVENDILQCPYEDSHQILRGRFQVHLVRCRRSHPNAELVTCPFNNTHHINKQELDWHVSTCTERQSYELFKTCDAPVPGLSSSLNKSFCGNQTVPIETDIDDDWNHLPLVPSYDPQQYVETAPVLRQPVGMPPAQRVSFREAERKRLRSLIDFAPR